MSVANSKTRRAEPRTEADLRARGYRLAAIGRPPHDPYDRRNRPPMEYAVKPVDGDEWIALIKGPAHQSTLHPKTSKGWFRARPIGWFESRVAAAHAALDRLGVE